MCVRTRACAHMYTLSNFEVHGKFSRMWQGEDLFLGHGQATRPAFCNLMHKMSEGSASLKMQRRGGIEGNRHMI